MAVAITKIIDAYIDVLRTYKVWDHDAIIQSKGKYLDNIDVEKPKKFEDGEYVPTTLEEALTRLKKPIHIPVKKHEDGTLECAQIPGLLVKKYDDGIVRAYGTRIDDVVRNELPMKYLLLCRANAIRFDTNNVIGSARYAISDLGDNPNIKHSDGGNNNNV